MTEREPWAALLDRAIPAVPDRLRAAPLIAIRERARRRRADVAITAGLVVAILACSAFALSSWLRPTPTTLDPTQPAPRSAIPWAIVRVQADQRVLSVGVFNPGEPHCAGFAPVLSIVEEPSRVIMTVTSFSTAGRCDEANPTVAVLPATLRSPLGARVIVDGYDGRSPAVVQARWFPIPTHLLRLEVGADQPATAAGDRLGWAMGYGGVGGPGLGFFASYEPPTISGGEPIRVNGHDALLTEILETGRGHGFQVVWQVDGVWIEMRVGWGPEETASRSELQRVLDGLRWQ